MELSFPSEYTYACDYPRSELTVRLIAHNQEVYPDRIAQTPSGWLVHDRYERQVVELDENLRRVRTWGRHGPGPMDYERPVGLGRLDSDHVVVVDNEPPSLIVFGPTDNEYRIVGLQGRQMEHAIVADGRILIATRDATVHEVTLDGQTRILHSRHDFGLPGSRRSGAPASPRLRPGHIGLRGPSAIWTLGTHPQKAVQRCVHDDLEKMLKEAPRIDLGPPFGVQPYNVATMQDFLPLGAGGFLAMGGLVLKGSARLRSIERYDSSGVLLEAWKLIGYPEVNAIFDEHNIGRLLIWNEESIDGIQLVETKGMYDVGGR